MGKQALKPTPLSGDSAQHGILVFFLYLLQCTLNLWAGNVNMGINDSLEITVYEGILVDCDIFAVRDMNEIQFEVELFLKEAQNFQRMLVRLCLVIRTNQQIAALRKGKIPSDQKQWALYL